MTSYELYMYAHFDNWNVQYIQFDSEMNPHYVGEPKLFKKLYDEWNDNLRCDENIFTALIQWFDLDYQTHTIKIKLYGCDGRLHYENQ